MNTLQKIGLGIGALTLATLPFFMREKPPREELVDVLCRDAYERGCEYFDFQNNNMWINKTKHEYPGSQNDIRLNNKTFHKCKWNIYSLHGKDILVFMYGDEGCLRMDHNHLNKKETPEKVELAKTATPEGTYIDDMTPQKINKQTIKGVQIVDSSNVTRQAFTPEELQELEQIARTNIKYRAMEREIFEDVAETGKVDIQGIAPLINLSHIGEKIIPTTIIQAIQEYIPEVKVVTLKEKVYNTEKDESIRVLVELRRRIPIVYDFSPRKDQERRRMSEYFDRYDDTDTPDSQPIPQHRLEQLVEFVRGSR